MENISIIDALVTALTGYGVVFLGIILLMIVVMIMGSIFSAKEKKAAAAAPAPAPVEAPKATAPGTAGELKQYRCHALMKSNIVLVIAFAVSDIDYSMT